MSRRNTGQFGHFFWRTREECRPPSRWQGGRSCGYVPVATKTSIGSGTTWKTAGAVHVISPSVFMRRFFLVITSKRVQRIVRVPGSGKRSASQARHEPEDLPPVVDFQAVKVQTMIVNRRIRGDGHPDDPGPGVHDDSPPRVLDDASSSPDASSRLDLDGRHAIPLPCVTPLGKCFNQVIRRKSSVAVPVARFPQRPLGSLLFVQAALKDEHEIPRIKAAI